jgi:hypothetical protein
MLEEANVTISPARWLVRVAGSRQAISALLEAIAVFPLGPGLAATTGG